MPIDAYAELKARFAGAAQVSLDVLITIRSDVFDTFDSTSGEIVVASDGRYYARLSNDAFVFDGRCLWEYSAENNQATKDCLGEDERFESEFSFIKNLDRYYTAENVHPDSVYILRRRGDDNSSLPDSLTLYLTSAKLSRISYYDLNKDLNIVAVRNQRCDTVVTDSRYHMHLPDSTEIIVMP